MSFNEVKQNSLLTASAFSLRSTSNTVEDFILCDDGRYKTYECYYDEDYSVIDTSKNINVSASQINITQETNSQYIPFKMPRYWDGIDLMDMLIQIHWKNGQGYGNISDVVNVRYNDNSITFGWLINDSITSVAGIIQFEITAIGVNEKNENYKFRTRPNGKLTVLEALTRDGIVEPTNDWYVAFENTMLGYIAKAKEHSDSAKSSETSAIATYQQMQSDLNSLKEDVQESV